jgi:hypothetical protein
MTKIVLLDAGPLSSITHHNPTDEMQKCVDWAKDLRRRNVVVLVPQGSDYEVRRGYIRMNSAASLAQLDETIKVFGYLSVSDDAWRYASQLWADARTLGIQPTDNVRLDFDTLLAAQATILDRETDKDVWIATENIGHLGALYYKARLWDELGA